MKKDTWGYMVFSIFLGFFIVALILYSFNYFASREENEDKFANYIKETLYIEYLDGTSCTYTNNIDVRYDFNIIRIKNDCGDETTYISMRNLKKCIHEEWQKHK